MPQLTEPCSMSMSTHQTTVIQRQFRVLVDIRFICWTNYAPFVHLPSENMFKNARIQIRLMQSIKMPISPLQEYNFRVFGCFFETLQPEFQRIKNGLFDINYPHLPIIIDFYSSKQFVKREIAHLFINIVSSFVCFVSISKWSPSNSLLKSQFYPFFKNNVISATLNSCIKNRNNDT